MVLMKILGILAGLLIAGTGANFVCSPIEQLTGLSSFLGLLLGAALLFNAFSRFSRWQIIRQAGERDGVLFFEALVSLAFGILLLGSWALRDAFAVSVNMLLAIWASALLISTGVIRIARAMAYRRAETVLNRFGLSVNWVIVLAIGIVLTALGVISLFHPLLMLSSMSIFFGIDLFIFGLSIVMSVIFI